MSSIRKYRKKIEKNIKKKKIVKKKKSKSKSASTANSLVVCELEEFYVFFVKYDLVVSLFIIFGVFIIHLVFVIFLVDFLLSKFKSLDCLLVVLKRIIDKVFS